MKNIFFIISALILLSITNCNKKSDSIGQRFKEAEALESQIIESVNSIASCKENYEAILAQAPKSEYAPVACFKLGKLNQLFGHEDEAVHHYRDLLTVFPEHPLCGEALFNMAQIYLSESDKQTLAKETFGQVLMFYPQSKNKLEVLTQLVNLYSRDKDWPNVIQFLDDIIRSFPEKSIAADAYFRMGDILQNEMNQPEEAVKMYRQLIEKCPQSSWCVFANSRIDSLNEGGLK